MFLDNHTQADQVQRRLLNACLRAQLQEGPLQEGQLGVAIVGAGATGVELAAELHKATRRMVAYGLDRIDPERDVKISLIEAAPRVLPALPVRLSTATTQELQRLGVQIHAGEQVVEVTEAEIADTLGCSAGTVKSQAARAIARLRTLLGPEADLAPPGPRTPGSPGSPGPANQPNPPALPGLTGASARKAAARRSPEVTHDA